MRRAFLPVFVAAVLFAFAGAACGSGSEPARPDSAGAAAPPAAPATDAVRPRIVFLGDSLTAGLGLPESESYPTLIQRKLDEAGYAYEVVNAGVSGDTSAGALRRLDWALEGDVRVLVVAVGGNDGLRGLATDALEQNLTAIVEGGQQRGARVILAGMEAPPNNGPAYTGRFREAFRTVAEAHDVPLIPFLLEGVAGVAGLNQGDGIHPNARGAAIVADTVWRALEPALDEPSESDR